MGILFIDTHCSKNFALGFADNNLHFFEKLEGADPSIEMIQNIEKIIANFLEKHARNLQNDKSESNWDFENYKKNISKIILITGPGSLTGLRIGSAFALGIAMGLNISIQSLTIWDLLLEFATQESENNKIADTAEIFFYTGTKKWLHRCAGNEEKILEIEEIAEMNARNAIELHEKNQCRKWISNNPEKLAHVKDMSQNIAYPNIIELMHKYAHLATDDLNLIYNITLF